jgi:hypothetical protein
MEANDTAAPVNGAGAGAASGDAPELVREDSGFLWGILDGLITPPSTPGKDAPSAQKSAGSVRRKGMPSGCKSLVPEGYVPPHPEHKILFDGKMKSGRQLNVKNFYRHFCVFQDTPLNRGMVSLLEDLGEYKWPVWYSALLTSAAPTLIEHATEYEREELDDGNGGCVAVDWATPDGDVDEKTAVVCVCVCMFMCICMGV